MPKSLIEELNNKYNKLYKKLQNILINLEDRGICVYTKEHGLLIRVYSDNLALNILYNNRSNNRTLPPL
jgi:hypothetical protein